MSRMNPKVMMWIFGAGAIAAVAIFLMLYEGSPGPLSAPHAAVIRGATIFSCKQCHAEEGLTEGCLACHVEIAGQLTSDTGYHALMLRERALSCEPCHVEHLGAAFPLVSDLSWPDDGTNAFNHPQVEFTLTGKHASLDCDTCHVKKLREPFTLPDFPGHARTSTMLGLEQDCISCHEDIHKSGELTRDCLKCHNQEAFRPAPGFRHDNYFVLEGVHAKAACSTCHQVDEATLSVNRDGRIFGPVKGKGCADCHETPHREAVGNDCLSCHLGTDETWSDGRRGIDAANHTRFGFALEVPHAEVACVKCHVPELTYTERFPDPAAPDYVRRSNQCSGCHADPHDGQFLKRHSACLDCHYRDRFKPSTLGPMRHSDTYPLQGGHLAVACTQCHFEGETSGVRRFTETSTACKDCHKNPHGSQFDKTLLEQDCTACHQSDFSTFRIQEYRHGQMRPFFMGTGHMRASCSQCHVGSGSDRPIAYSSAPTACAACHQDVHRGQLQRSGATQCEWCHLSTSQWTSENFVHNRDARFALDGSHAKVECKACHQPVPQRDGKSVIQYRPLTTRCEDCHGFRKP